MTGKFEKNQFVARFMDHLIHQYDGPMDSYPPTRSFSGVGDNVDELRPVALILRRLLFETAARVDNEGILDREMSDVDQPEAYTAFKLVVSIPGQAAKEAKENPKVPELQDRPFKAYPLLLIGVGNNRRGAPRDGEGQCAGCDRI